MLLHKLWAHLGTLLAALFAGLADTQMVSTATNVQVMVTAVAGALIALHIPYAATFERDFQQGLQAAIKAYKAAQPRPPVPGGPSTTTLPAPQNPPYPPIP